MSLRFQLKKQQFMDELTKRNWSIEDFAEKAGMSFVHVYRILNGQRNPGNEFIATTIQLFESTIESFFLLSSLPSGNKAEESEVEEDATTRVR